MTVLPITKGGIFTYNTRWKFYVYQRVAVIPVTQGGSYTCHTGWQFYV